MAADATHARAGRRLTATTAAMRLTATTATMRLTATAAAVRLTATAAAVLLAAACGPGGLAGSGASASETPQEVVGIVTSIQGSSPAEVSSFTLRTDSGQVLSFEVGRVELAADSFPPGHLHDHLASAQPVRVTYVRQDTRLVATRLRDGP